MTAEIITLRDGSSFGRQLPPPGTFASNNLASLDSPQHAGSFLIDPKTREQAVFSPVDQATGIVLPIVTQRRLPAIGKFHDADGNVVADWNHNYHPKETLTRRTPVELALRNCRTEWVHRDDHTAYHNEFYGPDVAMIDNLMRPILFAAAGFIPPKGLRYDGRKHAEIVVINEATRTMLWRSGRVKIVNTRQIKDVLVGKALEKDFDGINESTIDEFLNTGDMKRRIELGSTLLSMVMHDLAAPMREAYAVVRREGCLPHNAPRSAGRCALKLVSQRNYSRAIRALTKRLTDVA